MALLPYHGTATLGEPTNTQKPQLHAIQQNASARCLL